MTDAVGSGTTGSQPDFDSSNASGAAPTVAAAHPGQQVRHAREARGQTLAHLSILLKISERRLQAFEAGRWSDVGDNTFVRALAKSLCRHLDLDPMPVLQGLPASVAEPRQQPSRGRLPDSSAPALKTLRAPIRLPGGSRDGGLFTPVRVAVVLILLGALAMLLVPSAWWEADPPPVAVPAALEPTAAASAPDAQNPASAPESPSAASAPEAPNVAPTVAPTVAPVPVATTVAPTVAPPVAATPTPAVPSPDPSTAPLQIRALQDSWVQVTDARGQVAFSRLLRAGEKVGVEGARPLRLRVGNVAGTEAVWQGKPVPLQDSQRNNVADLELP